MQLFEPYVLTMTGKEEHSRVSYNNAATEPRIYKRDQGILSFVNTFLRVNHATSICANATYVATCSAWSIMVSMTRRNIFGAGPCILSFAQSIW